MSRSDLREKVPLGRTGRVVSRLGIGSSYGVSTRACLRAFDRGVNYFFWGSARTPGMAHAIRDLSAHHREELLVVLQCYVRFASLMPRSVNSGLATLGLDHADVLLLGWYDRFPPPQIVAAAADLKQRGRVRHLAISTHQRPLARELSADERFDVLHLRYNAAHIGAERDVFPHLATQKRPGIVAFTCTRWGDLLNPKRMPPGEAPLSAADCYRFALSSPHVDVAICGPKNDAEMDHALTALDRGPLDEQEMQRARNIGAHVYGTKALADWFR